MPFELPNLPYSHDALAPHMSKETLEYHHDKHHQAYVTNGNNLLKGTEWENKPLEEVVKGSFGKNAGLFNNAAQHYNHLHFWKWMKPQRRRRQDPGRAQGQDRQRSRRRRQGQGRLHPGRRHPVRLRLVLDRGQGRQARHHQDGERREPAGARRQADPRLRRLGALLLHRPPQRPAGLSQGVLGKPDQLGLRQRDVPGRQQVTLAAHHQQLTSGAARPRFAFAPPCLNPLHGSDIAPATAPQSRWPDRLAYAVLAALALIAALTFRDYGLGWDDYTHAQYGDLLLSLYASGFHDTRALSFVNLYLYGGGFDMAAALLAKMLPFDLFETRRLLGAASASPASPSPGGSAAGSAGRLPGLLALRAARRLPALLRPHVHQSEGRAVCRGDGAVPARPGATARAISEALPRPRCSSSAWASAFRSARASWRASACSKRSARWRCCLRSRRATTASRRVLAARQTLARAHPERDPRLCGDGADLAVERGQSAQPGQGHRSLLAFLREAVAGAVRRPADRAAGHAAQLRPDAARPQAAGDFLLLWRRRRARRADRGGSPRTPPRLRAIYFAVALAAVLPIAVTVIARPAMYNGIRHFVFVLPPLAVAGGLAGAWIVHRIAERAGSASRRRWRAAQPCSPAASRCRRSAWRGCILTNTSPSTTSPAACSGAQPRFMLDYWGLAFKQAGEAAARTSLPRAARSRPPARKWKIAVCGPHPPARIALGDQFEPTWDPKGADFALMLGAFYCARLDAPLLAEIVRDGVSFARAYDIRGRTINNLFTRPPIKPD